MARDEFEDPPPGYIVFNFLGDTDTCILRFADVSWEGRFTTEQMHSALRDLFGGFPFRRSQEPVRVRWAESTEVLIMRLDHLLQQREALVEELRNVYHDLDIAETRVTELELLLQALQKEHGGTKEKRDKSVVVALVMGVSAILASISPAIANRVLEDPVAQTRQAANQVQIDCGANVEVDDHSININIANPPPPLPETG